MYVKNVESDDGILAWQTFETLSLNHGKSLPAADKPAESDPLLGNKFDASLDRHAVNKSDPENCPERPFLPCIVLLPYFIQTQDSARKCRQADIEFGFATASHTQIEPQRRDPFD